MKGRFLFNAGVSTLSPLIAEFSWRNMKEKFGRTRIAVRESASAAGYFRNLRSRP